MIPLVILMIGQNILFYYTTLWNGAIRRISDNAYVQLQRTVTSRKGYLSNEMVTRWSDLGGTATVINERMMRLAREKGSAAEVLADEALSQQLLSDLSQNIIYLLRKNGVTGAFVVLDSAQTIPGGVTRPGVYLRNPDPTSTSSDYSDLFMKRGSAELHRKLRITTDLNWTPRFTFLDSDPDSRIFFDVPLENARQYPELALQDMGYWSPRFALDPTSDPRMIAYSLPLLDAQGVPYGVVGVEISESYLAKLLPYQELSDQNGGAYCLVMSDNGGESYQPMATGTKAKGSVLQSTGALTLTAYPDHEGFQLLENTVQKKLVVWAEPLYLYSANTPHSNQQWMLLGVLDQQELLSLPYSINRAALVATFVSVLLGVALTYLIFQLLIRPIHGLIARLRSSNARQPVELSPVGVAEIDELSDAIRDLSVMVIDSASMLSRIIEMSGMNIAAFEYDTVLDHVITAGPFYWLMGQPQLADDRSDATTLNDFRTLLDSGSITVEEQAERQWLLRISTEQKTERWVRLTVTCEGSRTLGVAVDSTDEVLAKRRIEYERDYDTLTNLLNRRAFLAALQRLFTQPEQLGCAAMIMLDLDNLKHINDNYGHDSGDAYIQAAAGALKQTVLQNMLQARMSGDEFFVFLYGYQGKEPLQKVIHSIQQNLAAATYTPPGSEAMRIRCSAGVAWYPEDTRQCDELIRFADFAMYTAKNNKKGDFRDFERAVYNQNAYLLHSREELNKLIDNSLVDYHFQPIVNAATGEVFAYEALMRPTLATLQNPMEVLALARTQSKLYDIERITWFTALRLAKAQPGFMEGDCRLFVNSVSNYILSDEDIDALMTAHSDCLARVVLEVTESERFTEDLTEKKRSLLFRFGGQIALDDFGTGYNSDSALLLLAPDYVKIDISIVQGIDNDPARQGIFKNLVSYSKSRGIKVIAEGVETPQELATLIELGADYLQGYYLGRPAAHFVRPSPEVTAQITELSKALAKKTKI